MRLVSFNRAATLVRWCEDGLVGGYRFVADERSGTFDERSGTFDDDRLAFERAEPRSEAVLELFDELSRGGKSLNRILGENSRKNLVLFIREKTENLEIVRMHRIGVHQFVENRGDVVSRKRLLSAEHFEGHDSE